MNPLVERPVVASYCATFLKPEMLHIYRQITALERVRPIVIARKREETERFPFDDVIVTGKPRTHFLRRIWFKQLRKQPWQISRRETNSLVRILETAEARLLHIYFGHIAVHLLPLMRVWPRPVVVSFHGADVMVDLEKPAYRRATREMVGLSRLVLVRSDSLGRALADIGCAPDKLRLQRTGIPVEDIPFQPRDWPGDGAWKFVQACRLIEKKGLQVSLRAFAKFAERHPNSTFTIAGEGPLHEQLRAHARELGVDGRVDFAGFVSQNELRQLFYRSHIFLHPSETAADGNQEGIPNSMLEAMASGLPVFATAHGGIPEAITHQESGILVAEGDAEELARELVDMVARPDELARIARNGASVVADKFERRIQARQLEEFYFEAMTSAESRS
ncbi:MAG: glycosyltransferase [Chthoniobacterales bacterium]